MFVTQSADRLLTSQLKSQFDREKIGYKSIVNH